MPRRPTAGQRLVADVRSRVRCAGCGEDRDALIDFHHVDPESKDGKVLRLARDGAALERVQNELAKCVPLCPSCHRLVHLDAVDDSRLAPLVLGVVLARPTKDQITAASRLAGW